MIFKNGIFEMFRQNFRIHWSVVLGYNTTIQLFKYAEKTT